MKKQASLSAMTSRRRNVSEDPQTISRLSASDELLLNIPIYLVIEIFSRLPLKSILRCRCVSKRWASVLRRPDLTELFFTKSLERPKLLFACGREGEKEVVFFSTPQPQKLDKESSPIPAVHHVSFAVESVYDISSPLNGVVCISCDRILERSKTSEICNPSPRQSFSLPKMKTRNETGWRCFLGYDPVEKQHKVLAMTRQDNRCEEHQVLTLGTGNMTWRMAECGIPHSFPRRECLCINGVLYYTARISDSVDTLVCFDVRSEKFSFVNFMERGVLPATLINFQGKLASVKSSALLSETSTSFAMWILEDAEKHEWSKRIFNLPPTWKNTAREKFLYFQGVTARNEFVIAPLFLSVSDLLHVYYYNFVKETITRVEIQGMRASEKASKVRGFLNHVEDVKLQLF